MFTKFIFRFILHLIGWSYYDWKQADQLINLKKAVVVFSHTSYWDFWLIMLYRFAYPEYLKDVYIVMKPQPFSKWYGVWLHKFKFIPSTRLEDPSNNFVKRTKTLVDSKKRAYILISPKGMMNLNQWKSGFYYLAKGLNIPIVVVGLDFQVRQLRILKSHYVNNNESYDDMLEKLQKEMGNVVPLYPKCVPYKLQKYDINNVGVLDPFLINMILYIIGCYTIYSIDILYVEITLFIRQIIILSNLINNSTNTLNMSYYSLDWIILLDIILFMYMFERFIWVVFFTIINIYVIITPVGKNDISLRKKQIFQLNQLLPIMLKLI